MTEGKKEKREENILYVEENIFILLPLYLNIVAIYYFFVWKLYTLDFFEPSHTCVHFLLPCTFFMGKNCGKKPFRGKIKKKGRGMRNLVNFYLFSPFSFFFSTYVLHPSYCQCHTATAQTRKSLWSELRTKKHLHIYFLCKSHILHEHNL